MSNVILPKTHSNATHPALQNHLQFFPISRTTKWKLQKVGYILWESQDTMNHTTIDFKTVAINIISIHVHWSQEQFHNFSWWTMSKIRCEWRLVRQSFLKASGWIWLYKERKNLQRSIMNTRHVQRCESSVIIKLFVVASWSGLLKKECKTFGSDPGTFRR